MSRHPKVRLIQCLPESNKGLNKDFLIVSREWHDGLPYPARKGQLGGVLGLGCLFASFFCSFGFALFFIIIIIIIIFYLHLIKDFLVFLMILQIDMLLSQTSI